MFQHLSKLIPLQRHSRILPSLWLAIVLLSVTLTAQAQPQDHPNWVTTWSASISTLPNDDSDLVELENQTLRLIIHTSVGGNSLRLRLSNAHGDHPMQLGAVSIALQDEGSAIVTGSSKTVTFSGQSSVTIATGAVVISDPLSFDVPATSNLSVSLFLPQSSGFLTAHALANQGNYISSDGNQTQNMQLDVASETAAWHLLTALDVITERPTTAIVALGDSISDGWGSTAGLNQRWPNHFARRLYDDSSISDYAVINAGISGNRVTTQDNPRFGENLQARFERDVLALSNISHIVLLEGINDIGMSSSDPSQMVTAAEVIAGYRQIINRAHARQIKVIGATLTPYQGAAYYTEAGELVRQEVNAFIRSSGEFDGVIDFDKAAQDPTQPSRLIPSLTTDNLHLNDEGYKLMADSIDLDLFR